MCVPVCMHTCIQISSEAREGVGYPESRVTDSYELKKRLWSSAKSVSMLNH